MGIKSFVASAEKGRISDAVHELDNEISDFCGERMLKHVVVDIVSATDTYYDYVQTHGVPMIVRVIIFNEHQ